MSSRTWCPGRPGENRAMGEGRLQPVRGWGGARRGLYAPFMNRPTVPHGSLMAIRASYPPWQWLAYGLRRHADLVRPVAPRPATGAALAGAALAGPSLHPARPLGQRRQPVFRHPERAGGGGWDADCGVRGGRDSVLSPVLRAIATLTPRFAAPSGRAFNARLTFERPEHSRRSPPSSDATLGVQKQSRELAGNGRIS
jgi:hypothetical protein